MIFLKEPLTVEGRDGRARPRQPGVDEAYLGTGVLYFSRPTAKATGSRSNRIISSPIYPSVTIRNWNTTTTLVRMMDEV